MAPGAAKNAASGGPPGAIRRLMIREMVLENFKSYAGAQRVGPFHKSFSSVVGPNGSGKSNVIDAMLFVFGRRAKQLRFNKVSELIHNSTNYRNLETARVTVYFQEIWDKEGEDYDVIPGTEFTVARTAHRSNQSDYYVNDRKVSAKEVTDKLKGLGIDLDNNRFLILQGEVEQISMMKPKGEDKNDVGLLEYLEDIIGTYALVQPIEEQGKKLEEINEKRQGMIARLKVAEKEKDAVESKKVEAEEFLDKQAEMTRNKICAHHVNINIGQANISLITDKVGEWEEKLAYERNKFKNYDADVKEAEKKHAGVAQEFATIKKALDAAQEEFKGYERKDQQCQINMKSLKDKLKKTAKKMESDAANVQKLEAEVASIEEEVPKCKQQVEALSAELSNQERLLESMVEAIKDEVEGYHRQLTQVRSELAPWEKQMGEVNSRISVASAERDLLVRKGEDARRRLEAAVKALASAQAGAKAKAQQVKELEAAAAKCRQQIEAQKAELAASQQRETAADAAASEVRARVAALRADVNAQQNASGLMMALMTAKAKGEITGVYGRLGDLAAIDPKYDIAVSTAIGGLDWIVVDTTADAQRCVEYIRKHQLGLATCVILEQQRHLTGAANEKIKVPEGAERLYDLVRIRDDRLRPAFFKAFGHTLVAPDLDTASRIAYGQDRRFSRVVTMQGQLISESGTMSGGGGRPSRGRMALGNAAPRSAAVDAKAAAAELQAAEQQLEEATAALRKARDQVVACEGALRAAEKQLGELEAAAPKVRMEAEAESAKAADIQQRMEELQRATEVNADDARRISELEAAIKGEEATLGKLKQQTAGLEAKAAGIQAKIDGAGGDKLKKQKAAVAKLSKDIADLEAEIARKGVHAKAAAKQVDKLKKDAAKDAAEHTRLEGEVEKLEGELKEMETQALKVMELVATTQDQLDQKQTEVDAAHKALEELQASHSIVRKTEMEFEQRLEEYKKKHKEENAKVVAWQAQVEALQSKLSEFTGSSDVFIVEESMLSGKKADEFMFKVAMLEAELEKLNPDMGAIEEYRSKEADFKRRAAELEAVTAERDEVRRTYEGLRKRRLDEFMSAFNTISLKLKEMYQMITLGGDAELELVDSLDPFSEGIVFSVRPPKKSWKNISNLSGGEKTLSSLSLVFALHHYKPTPLYVMDEIDAALDFKNVSIVGHYIKERTKNAQFVIISLRNNMFELADRLVGIYKTDNTTKTVTINPGEFVVPRQQQQGQQEQENAQQQQPLRAQAVAVS